MKRLNIILIIVFNVLSTNAQIISTDISPDFSIALEDTTPNIPNIYSIDMNNDEIEDFNFSWQENLETLRLTSSNPNNAMLIGILNSLSGGSFLDPLLFQENIDSTQNFTSNNPFPVIKDMIFGNFQNQDSTVYAGVRFEVNGQLFYGWILFDFEGNNFIIKEYAYNSIPDSSIGAGEIDTTTLGLILVESVTIQNNNTGFIELVVGESLALETVILPSNASDTTLTWLTFNQSGSATINQNGLISGVSQGTVSVYVIANDGSESSDLITVNVISPIDVNNIDIFSQNGENQILVNNNLQIGASIFPNNATNDSLSWSVVNITGSGTIDQNGLFSSQNTGIVCIKAMSTDETNISDSLLIEINDLTILVDSINVRNVYGFENVSISQTLQMTADIFPNFADDTSVNWSIESITGTANISQTGLLNPESIGTVRVIASTNDGSQASGETIVTIVELFSLQNIIVNTISGNDIVNLNGFTQMQANLIPQEIQNLEIQWSVEDLNGSAFIDDSGLLSPTSIGSVLVIATSLDGSNIQGEKIINIEDLTGIKENFKKNLVYPNPFKNKIIFSENKEIELIEISSIQGKIIYKGNYKPTINTDGFNNGIYIVKLILKNNREENLMMIKNL